MHNWEEMTPEQQSGFWGMPEKELRERWNTDQGQEIIKKIIGINLKYGNHTEYKEFIGTVKSSYSKKPAQIDLRGINFSGYSNLINNEYFGFDFLIATSRMLTFLALISHHKSSKILTSCIATSVVQL